MLNSAKVALVSTLLILASCGPQNRDQEGGDAEKEVKAIRAMVLDPKVTSSELLQQINKLNDKQLFALRTVPSKMADPFFVTDLARRPIDGNVEAIFRKLAPHALASTLTLDWDGRGTAFDAVCDVQGNRKKDDARARLDLLKLFFRKLNPSESRYSVKLFLTCDAGLLTDILSGPDDAEIAKVIKTISDADLPDVVRIVYGFDTSIGKDRDTLKALYQKADSNTQGRFWDSLPKAYYTALGSPGAYKADMMRLLLKIPAVKP